MAIARNLKSIPTEMVETGLSYRAGEEGQESKREKSSGLLKVKI